MSWSVSWFSSEPPSTASTASRAENVETVSFFASVFRHLHNVLRHESVDLSPRFAISPSRTGSEPFYIAFCVNNSSHLK
jgi:hypothetical protein